MDEHEDIMGMTDAEFRFWLLERGEDFDELAAEGKRIIDAALDECSFGTWE